MTDALSKTQRLKLAGVSEHRARRDDLKVTELKSGAMGARAIDKSELHRLHRLGKITARQRDDGERLWRDWQGSGLNPWPTGQERVSRSGRPMPGMGPTGAEYHAAMEHVAQQCGLIAQSVLWYVAVQDKPVTQVAGDSASHRTLFALLRRALDALGEHYD